MHNLPHGVHPNVVGAKVQSAVPVVVNACDRTEGDVQLRGRSLAGSDTLQAHERHEFLQGRRGRACGSVRKVQHDIIRRDRPGVQDVDAGGGKRSDVDIRDVRGIGLRSEVADGEARGRRGGPRNVEGSMMNRKRKNSLDKRSVCTS